MIGLYAFFYASLHFINYIAIDQALEWNAIIEDVTEHKRIISGFISFVIYWPLIYAVMLSVLFGYRVVLWLLKKVASLKDDSDLSTNLP